VFSHVFVISKVSGNGIGFVEMVWHNYFKSRHRYISNTDQLKKGKILSMRK